jgi:hypothetical protein
MCNKPRAAQLEPFGAKGAAENATSILNSQGVLSRTL